MKGNIDKLPLNQYGNRTFGFICGENEKSYFFYKTSLTNCTIQQLSEGDCVEFDEVVDSSNKGPVAENIRKTKSLSNSFSNNANPGINRSINLSDLNSDELKIVNDVLGKTFYVTNGGSCFKMARSTYKYILVKPTKTFTALFNLSREIVVIFSDYISFEPRSLDAASYAYKLVPAKVRIDKGCHIIIGNDDNIEKQISTLLKDRNMDSIVVPFSYKELLSGDIGSKQIEERFRKYLFDVDLFATSSPIENDMFFFGRRDYVLDIVSKCKSGSMCGVFGLRRSGKTSLLLAVKRILSQENVPTLLIPCQSDLISLNWKSALYKIMKEIALLTGQNLSCCHTEDDYRKKCANTYFEDDTISLISSYSTPVVLMFDEIEKITYGIEESGEAWQEGDSFTTLWNVIRGFCIKHPGKISIVIAGTNPMINEIPFFDNNIIANPMYGQLTNANQGAYLPMFDVDSTKIMVNTLGGYMGLKFNDTICNRLVNDCGGHPYLIRLLCSSINKYIRNRNLIRPIEITKAIYDKALPEFEKSGSAEGFFLMILNILQNSFSREYETLKILATQGDDQLSKILDNSSILHLTGYGIIENNQGNYAIRFDTISRFLKGKYTFERQGLNIEEQCEEISARFNPAERSLRKLVKNVLLQSLGPDEAKKVIIKTMTNNIAIRDSDLQEAKSSTYKQLFDTTLNKMFFSILSNTIYARFDLFKNVFDLDKDKVNTKLQILNKARRLPDHNATNIIFRNLEML